MHASRLSIHCTGIPCPHIFFFFCFQDVIYMDTSCNRICTYATVSLVLFIRVIHMDMLRLRIWPLFLNLTSISYIKHMIYYKINKIKNKV